LEYAPIVDDGGLEHRSGLLAAFLALAGAGVAVMIGFATVTNLVWPIIAGGAATVCGAYGALAALYRLWPFRRRPDPLRAKLQALVSEGIDLRGPEQKPPSGAPVGDVDAVEAWYTKVQEALASKPQLVARFRQGAGITFNTDPAEVRRYKTLATRINNLTQIIDQFDQPTTPSPPSLPPPISIPPTKPDPKLPYN
jgi:hypothetical protein